MNQIPNIEETHNTREVEDWEVIKTDIHSPFLVMLHSTLINSSIYKTSGEMAQAVIKVFEQYAVPSLVDHQLQKVREEAVAEFVREAEEVAIYNDGGIHAFVYIETLKTLAKQYGLELDQDKQ